MQQIQRNEELGFTLWVDTKNQSVAIGLEASWYVRTLLSLPVELNDREVNSQICEELQIQFPSETSQWHFDYAALNPATAVDGLGAWEVFALSNKHMDSLLAMCNDKQWKLVCVAPLSTLAQGQWGSGVRFYPSRQQRLSQLWRKRCLRGGMGLCAGILLSMGLGSGYSIASAYWGNKTNLPKEVAPVQPLLAKEPSLEPWMAQEFGRIQGPLEHYPLEELLLVGVIHQSGKTNALIRIKQPQNLELHSVRVGDYLGNKFGRIVIISPESIWIHERLQDDSGAWIERESRLQLVSNAV